MTRPAPPARLDHLVIAARTLADGIAYVAEATGAAPQPGGRHLSMGTHNALLGLGDGAYLEIIAIDPEGTRPPRPRWFDLDDGGLQARLAERPRLVHWVARTDDIERDARACPVDLGPICRMARGAFRWRITIPYDGARPGNGLVPALIQWHVAEHPAAALPGSRVSLEGLAATHPDPGPIRSALAALGLDGVLPVAEGRDTLLAATLRAPRGGVTLRS